MEVEDEDSVQDDPTDEFVTKIGSPAYLYKCKCCGASLNGKKRKLTMHIASQKFAPGHDMNVRVCNPPPFVKQGSQLVHNTEGRDLLQRARPLLLKNIAHWNEQAKSKLAKKDVACSVAQLESRLANNEQSCPVLCGDVRTVPVPANPAPEFSQLRSFATPDLTPVQLWTVRTIPVPVKPRTSTGKPRTGTGNPASTPVPATLVCAARRVERHGLRAVSIPRPHATRTPLRTLSAPHAPVRTPQRSAPDRTPRSAPAAGLLLNALPLSAPQCTAAVCTSVHCRTSMHRTSMHSHDLIQCSI